LLVPDSSLLAAFLHKLLLPIVSVQQASTSPTLEPRVQPHSQLPCDQPQIQDRHVPLAPFHRADEGPVELAALGQLLLGQVLLQPPLADAVAQLPQEMLVVEGDELRVPEEVDLLGAVLEPFSTHW